MVLKKDTFIRTYTGKLFSAKYPEEHDYDVFDIAHALSLTCRYNGHCKEFYSVAEHSCHLYDYVSDEAKYYALMHDASEAYLGDIPKPIKVLLPEYLEMENTITKLIMDGFKVPRNEGVIKEVFKSDKRIVFNEMLRILPDIRKTTEWMSNALVGVRIECWEPERAEKEFLNRWVEVCGRVLNKE